LKVSVKSLSHHPANRSIYDLSAIEPLMTSINEMGLLQKLVVDQYDQVISGNRRLEAVKRLGWKSVEIEKVQVSDDETIPLLVSYNQQRVKTNKELLQEYWALEKSIGVGKGNRTDLKNVTCVRPDTSSRNPSTRDKIADRLGVTSSHLGSLVFIHGRNPDFIKLIDDGILTINKARQHLNDGHKYTFAHGENRKPNDFYNTPTSLTDHLLRVEEFNKTLTICEPATGNNAIADVLRRNWNPDLVTSYDLEVDFFKDETDYDYIITNPPFSKATDFILHAKKRVKKKFCLLLPLNYLHGKQRYEEVYTDRKYGLSKVHILTRSLLLNDGPIRRDGKAKGGMLVFAWYVFENGYDGQPQISWIDNGGEIY
jgi:hypothetical protein